MPWVFTLRLRRQALARHPGESGSPPGFVPLPPGSLSHWGAVPRPVRPWPSGARYLMDEGKAGFLALAGLAVLASGRLGLAAGRLSSSAVMP